MCSFNKLAGTWVVGAVAVHKPIGDAMDELLNDLMGGDAHRAAGPASPDPVTVTKKAQGKQKRAREAPEPSAAVSSPPSNDAGSDSDASNELAPAAAPTKNAEKKKKKKKTPSTVAKKKGVVAKAKAPSGVTKKKTKKKKKKTTAKTAIVGMEYPNDHISEHIRHALSKGAVRNLLLKAGCNRKKFCVRARLISGAHDFLADLLAAACYTMESDKARSISRDHVVSAARSANITVY